MGPSMNGLFRPALGRLLSLVAIVATTLTPLASVKAAYAIAAEARPLDSAPAPTAAATPTASLDEAVLFRTRITVADLHRFQRLNGLRIAILEQRADWAAVLVDFDQLETLARLGFRPSSADSVHALVAAHAQSKPWLARALAPLLASASATPHTLMARADRAAAAESLASLRKQLAALSPEQLAGVASLTSIDDDADGLTNTEESWWCTGPLDADSDDDRTSDGAEVAALRAWMDNRAGGYPAAGRPFAGWPPHDFDPLNPPTCRDGDHDSTPDLAEIWDLGLSADEESTDRDQYDDGQELFGSTQAGVGTLPPSGVTASMPAFVVAPGKHPLVAAFPSVRIQVEPSSIKVRPVATITSGSTTVDGRERTYGSTVTEGTSTSVENTENWNDWQEVAESVEQVAGAARARPADQLPGTCLGGPDLPDSICIDEGGHENIKFADDCLQTPFDPPGPDVTPQNLRKWFVSGGDIAGSVIGVPIPLDAVLPDGTPNPGFADLPLMLGRNCVGSANKSGLVDPQTPAPGFPGNTSASQDAIDSIAVQSNTYTPRTQRTDPVAGSAAQRVIINNNFDTSGIERGLEGLQLTYKETGELLGARLQDIRQEVANVAGGIGEVARILSSPKEITSTVIGSSTGGALSTAHTDIEEHTLTTQEAILTQEEWSTATATNTARAGELRFSYTVKNDGTDYARKICDVAFNVWLGDDPYPIATYWVGPDLGNADGCFHNFEPGEEKAYSIPYDEMQPIALSLDQMEAIDVGGSLRITVADYTLDTADLYRDDALAAGVLVVIEDGLDDGDGLMDSYVIPARGMSTLLDVMARYFPYATDADGHLIAIWTPEPVIVVPGWCEEPLQYGDRTWCRHALSTADWWDVFTSQPRTEGDGFEDAPAVPGSLALLRFNRDTDHDGFSDRTETALGSDPADWTSYPAPAVTAGIHQVRSGNQVHAIISIRNTGLHDAYGVQAVMLAPDASVTVTDNTIGGSARVKGLSQAVVGSRIRLQDPLPAAWSQPDHAAPAAGGYFTGMEPVTYNLTVACNVPAGCGVGEGTWGLDWSATDARTGHIHFGAGYASPLYRPMGSQGVEVALLTGKALNGETFQVAAAPPADTFAYTINTPEAYTEPLVIVSYNDARGGHRFMLPPAAMHLGKPTDDLLPLRGQMLRNPGVEILPLDALAEGVNTTRVVISNPSAETTLADARLYVEFIDTGGNVVRQQSLGLPASPGPAIAAVTWDTSSFTPLFSKDEDYLMMVFLADRQDSIVDTDALPIYFHYADSPMKIALPQPTASVGTVLHSETFAALATLLGASHAGGPAQQAATFRLRGVAGQPAVGVSMSGGQYRLRSGFGTAVSRLQQATAPAAGTVARTAANGVIDRYPVRCFPLANTGRSELKLRAVSTDPAVTITEPPATSLNSGQFTPLCARLNTDGLPVGPFDRTLPVYTSDPTHPVVELHLTGTVLPSGQVVFVHDYEAEARPLNKIVHVNSTRAAGEMVRFRPEVPGDTAALHPLYVYGDSNETAPLGKGEVLGGSTARQAASDSATTELTLPAGTAERRDYIVRYGYRATLPTGGGTATYQFPLATQAYATVALDIVTYGLAAGHMTLSLDVGTDGSTEWTFAGDVDPAEDTVSVADDRLTAAVNAWLAGHGGAAVPVRLVSDTGGTYFLANLRGAPSTDADLAATALTVSDEDPKETDVVTLCATTTNQGAGAVAASVTDFIVGLPEAGANILIDYAALGRLAAGSGAHEDCVDFDTTGFVGQVVLYGVTDYLGQVAESNETNNVISRTLTIRSRPDLRVAQMALSDAEPMAGESITATLTVRNGGQTNAVASRVTLYDGNPDKRGTLLGESTLSVAAGADATVNVTWKPTAAGPHQLFARVDADRAVNEYDEGNNDSWRDVYVGFASPLLIDSGGGASFDPAYTPELGFGALNGDNNTFCGSDPTSSQRSGVTSSVVQYRFDHLLPGHFYHLDLILMECDGMGRTEQVRVDDNLISDPIDLSDGAVKRLSFRLDPAFYGDRGITVSVEEIYGNDAIVSEINLYDIDYRYADAGASNEPAYSTARGYGWLDGVAQSTWGTLPYQTRRIDLADSDPSDDPDNELRYRYDHLDKNKKYQLWLKLYQGAGTATIKESISVDSVDTGAMLQASGVGQDEKIVDVPAGMYSTDGAIVVRIVRQGATAGAWINEIALEELTLTPPGCQDVPVKQVIPLHSAASGPNWFSFNIKPPVQPPAACSGVNATSLFTTLYGQPTLAGAPAPVGSIVEAFTPGGVKTGCFKVTDAGLYGYMRVYGAEGSTAGMQPGDPILLKINGIAAATTPYPLVWQDDKATREVNLDAPDVVPVETLLNPIAGKYTKLQCENGTYLPPPADPRFNTCTTIAAGGSYLLWMNPAANLTISGCPVAQDKPITLHAGYNWLGYLPTCELAVATALQTIQGKYDIVHSEAGTYKPPPANPNLNNFNTLAPGRGYMIHMTQAATLTYPANLCGSALRADAPAESTAGSCAAQPTARFTHYYGQVDAPAGSEVLAYSPAGQVVGCGRVGEEGLLPYLRVYGAEGDAPGMQDGEAVRFTVAGQPLAAHPAWRNDWNIHRLGQPENESRTYLPLLMR